MRKEGAVRSLLFGVICVCGTVALADGFYLKDTSGNETGPYVLRDGERVRLGQTPGTVSKVVPKRNENRDRLAKITLENVSLEDADIRDAVEFLQKACDGQDSGKKGIRLILVLAGLPEQERIRIPRVTLKARSISLLEALQLVAVTTGLRMYTEDATVRISSPKIPEGPIVTRTYDALPCVSEKVRTVSVNDTNSVAEARNEWKDFFAGLGVEWPNGSSITYVPMLGKLIVANTARNHDAMRNALDLTGVTPHQVEVELQYVAFELAAIDPISAGGIRTAGLLELRAQGKGRLIACPKVVTQSGVQATVKGVTAFVLPPELAGARAAATNSASPAAPVESGAVAVQDVGVTLTVLPESSAGGGPIYLTMSPEIVEDPTVRQREVSRKDAPAGPATVAAPDFHKYVVNSSVAVGCGSTVLVGGGLPSRDRKDVVFCFVTARLIGINGEDLASRLDEKDEEGRLF
jgi:hypothetical protein